MAFDSQKFERTVGKEFLLELQRGTWGILKYRLLDASRLAKKDVPPQRLTELNELLWAAFRERRNEEMLRLAKEGADPYSIERRLDREQREAGLCPGPK